MVTEVIYCRHCGSDDVVKNGLAPNNGKQKYLCHACGRQSREDPSPNGYTEERKEEILRAYQERSSLRGLRRTFGLSPSHHVERWINTLGQRLSRFVRKTLSFSKSRQMHHCCLKLFICRYNLERRNIIPV